MNDKLEEKKKISELTREVILTCYIKKYNKDPLYRKSVRNFFYDQVYRSSTVYTGYVSNDVFVKRENSTKDHFLCPRLMISAIVEQKQDLLYDKEEFFKIFDLCTNTICVLKSQNNDVKYDNVDNIITVKQLTIDKYDKYGPWWKLGSRKHILGTYTEFPLKDKIPKWFTKYEKKLLVKTT